MCLDDALTLATGFEVELFMEAELLLREIAEPLAARGLYDWERADGRTQAEVQRVVGKALMRASAMERSQNGGRS